MLPQAKLLRELLMQGLLMRGMLPRELLMQGLLMRAMLPDGGKHALIEERAPSGTLVPDGALVMPGFSGRLPCLDS